MTVDSLRVSAPGRICLFGEHQDYLGLPVIAAAIDRRIFIEGRRRKNRVFHIDLPDIGAHEIIDLNQPIVYQQDRDYFRSAIKVLQRENLAFPNGYDCAVRGNIPINSGTSSSSALVVAWVKFLLTVTSDKRCDLPRAIAQLAHQAEVVEFDEPGGMMDHFTSCLGSVLYIDCIGHSGPARLPARLGHFVLGDSLEPKDTKGLLARVKGGTLGAMEILKKADSSFNISHLSLDQLQVHEHLLTAEQRKLLLGNIMNRGLTRRAKELLGQEHVDHSALGRLLNAHQRELCERLHISTPTIDRMIDAALENGALGAKINGSGGGGCMFAYAPDSCEQVAEALLRVGGKASVLSIDEGVRYE